MNLKMLCRESPCNPAAKTVPSLLRAQIQSLVEEQRSHNPHCLAKKKKKMLYICSIAKAQDISHIRHCVWKKVQRFFTRVFTG